MICGFPPYHPDFAKVFAITSSYSAVMLTFGLFPVDSYGFETLKQDS